MDDLARYNQARWEALAQARISFSRPMLGLDAASARELVDPEGMMGEAAGRDVLCLAGGGGQQSAAFALLGARVTVLDLCETQLERDREAAAHYGTEVTTCQGDMRDLSRFGAGAFDVVWHAHSLNFVPDARRVFGEVARVLRPGGLYRMSCTNPFLHTTWEDDWTGEGYLLRDPYVDGAEIVDDDPCWEFDPGDGTTARVVGPREFRHALSTLANGLIEAGFALLGIWEDGAGDADADAEPGSWQHFTAIAPPWLVFWARRTED